MTSEAMKEALEEAARRLMQAASVLENLGHHAAAAGFLSDAKEARAALTSPPAEQGAGETLRGLVIALSDALTDEGPCWSNTGLLRLRCRVASALPPDECPDWLHPYRNPGADQ